MGHAYGMRVSNKIGRIDVCMHVKLGLEVLYFVLLLKIICYCQPYSLVAMVCAAATISTVSHHTTTHTRARTNTFTQSEYIFGCTNELETIESVHLQRLK